MPKKTDDTKPANRTERVIMDGFRARAIELYADSDTEIDENAEVSIGDDGAWVAAWVHVPGEKL